MLIARAVAVACLTVLKWMLWFVAALLVILIVAQYLRGEEAQRLAQAMAVLVSAATGALCEFLAERFRRVG